MKKKFLGQNDNMVTCVQVARLCEKGYGEKEGLDTRWVEILRHILVLWLVVCGNG
jgi:hypothetical protein